MYIREQNTTFDSKNNKCVKLSVTLWVPENNFWAIIKL